MIGEEEWRAVVGWEGFYEVSSLGRVRSIPRMSRVNSVVPERKRLMGGIVRKPTLDIGGYQKVPLTAMGRKENRCVHHLVLEAFVGPRVEGKVTRHLDNNPANNRADNLLWGTHTENMGDRKLAGNYATGASHPMATYDEGMIEAAVFLREILGLSPGVIARAYGVSRTHMYRILNGGTGWEIESKKVRAREAVSDSAPWMQRD